MRAVPLHETASAFRALGTGDEQQTPFPQRIGPVLVPVHVGGGDLPLEWRRARRHAGHRDGLELQPLYRMHGGQPDAVSAGPRVLGVVSTGVRPAPVEQRPVYGRRVVPRAPEALHRCNAEDAGGQARISSVLR